MNVDAALFPDLGRMVMGAVLRDHNGRCLAAVSEPLHGFNSLEYAEALALRRAVTITRDRGVAKATFVSDCLSLIQRLNSTVHPSGFSGQGYQTFGGRFLFCYLSTCQMFS